MSDYREKKNARLLMAIHGLQAEPNQQWEDRLVDALNHHTEFYVPMRTVGEGQERKPAFAVVEDKDHNHFYVLFTSKEKAKHWTKGLETHAILSFHQVASMALGDPRISGFVINMNTENFIMWRQFIVNCFHKNQANLMGQDPVQVSEEIVFTDPVGNTKDLEEALTEYMRDDLNITSAYMLGARQNNKNFNVCIVSHVGSIQPSFSNISLLGKDFGGDTPMAVMSYQNKKAEEAVKDRMPFYRRPFVL
jgi:hypothetical protein